MSFKNKGNSAGAFLMFNRFAPHSNHQLIGSMAVVTGERDIRSLKPSRINMGQVLKLLPIFNGVLVKTPDDINARLARASLYEANDLDIEKALADYRYVLKLEPTNEKAQEGIDRLSPHQVPAVS